MRNIFFIITAIAIMFLCNCAGEGQTQSTSENYGGYSVQKLFTVDNITVYRFFDDGRYHYFTNKRGIMETEYSCGKSTFVEEIECN